MDTRASSFGMCPSGVAASGGDFQHIPPSSLTENASLTHKLEHILILGEC